MIFSAPAPTAAQLAAVLAQFGVPRATSEAVFADLAEMYAGEGRFYHTLAHVGQVLAGVRMLRAQAENLPVVQLAAWFHDVVYDPRAAGNEARSAAYAQAVLGGAGVSPVVLQEVGVLILATEAHAAAPGARDCRVLLDADLAILGAPQPVYGVYAAAIRREYGWAPDDAYRAGRTRILDQFLLRERIFFTPAMYAALETQARANLQNEIDILTGNA